MRTAIALLASMLLVGCRDDDVSRLLGARCENDAHCDERCLAPSNDTPDGFCTLACTDSGDCPAGAECVDKEGGICLFDCDDNRDCTFLGPNWICRAENLRAEPNMQVNVCLGD